MTPGRGSSPPSRALAPPGVFVCALLLVAFLAPPLSLAWAQDDEAPTVIMPNVEPKHGPYTKAYVAMGAGLALGVTSFLLAESADRAYERYQNATSPEEIEDAYNDANRLDDYSAVAVLAGTASFALGAYWRWLKRPPPRDSALETSAGPALALEPTFGRHNGVALALRF